MYFNFDRKEHAVKIFNTVLALLCLCGSLGLLVLSQNGDTSLSFWAAILLSVTLFGVAGIFGYEAFLFWTSTTVIKKGTVVSTHIVPPSVSPVSAMAPMGIAHGASTVTTVEVREFPDEIFTYSGVLIREPGDTVNIRCYMRKGTLMYSELVV